MIGVRIPPNWREPDLDLGMDHLLWWNESPEEPRCEWDGTGNFYRGAWIRHPKQCVEGAWCTGHITLGGDGWTLHTADPVTISPSLACDCGDHGFIQGGKWVPA